MRQVKGVQGRYKAGKRVQERYEASKRGARWV